jgi:hypothetical protein
MCLLEPCCPARRPSTSSAAPRSHRAADHPLRVAAGLLAPVAIEYAAQAMALHGTLCAAPGSPPRRVTWPRCAACACTCRAWTRAGALRVSASASPATPRQALYAFALHDEPAALLVDGRATVVLDTPLQS